MRNTTQAIAKLGLTTGRVNPLHNEHLNQVFSKLLSVSGNSPFRTEEGKIVPYVFIMGSSGDDRNRATNPFSYDQRVTMALIGTEEIWKTKMWPTFSSELQKELSRAPIASLIDVQATFPKHFDNKEKNDPPKLDSLAQFIINHCEEHNLPISQLIFQATVKPGELGREYQLFGNRYHNCHQIAAVGQYLQAEVQQELLHDSADQQMVSATKIRYNLAENFVYLHPKIFQYIQQEMALALIHDRKIGDDKSTDHTTNVSEFVNDLASEYKMLSFDETGGAKISKIPEEKEHSFTYYRVKAQEAHPSIIAGGATTLAVKQEQSRNT